MNIPKTMRAMVLEEPRTPLKEKEGLVPSPALGLVLAAQTRTRPTSSPPPSSSLSQDLPGPRRVTGDGEE